MWTGGYVQLPDKRDVKGTRSCCPTFGGYVVGKAMVSCCAFGSHGQSMLACLTLDSGEDLYLEADFSENNGEAWEHLKHLEIRIWVSPSKHPRSSEICDTWGFLLSFFDDLFFGTALICFDILEKPWSTLGTREVQSEHVFWRRIFSQARIAGWTTQVPPRAAKLYPSIGWVGWFITFSSCFFWSKSESVGYLVSWCGLLNPLHPGRWNPTSRPFRKWS